MMLDDDVVAVSPASVYRVLKTAGRLDRQWLTPSKKGTGFVQPLAAPRTLARRRLLHQRPGHVLLPHEHPRRCQPLPRPLGAARNHDRAGRRMTVQRALEKYPGVTPRIISDNGPQFIARDFKEFIRFVGITHVRTQPLLPAIQRQAGTLARIAQTRMRPPGLSRHRGRSAASRVRLRRALQPGSLALSDRLHHAGGQASGLADVIFAERDRKLEEARGRRQQARQAAREVA